MPGYSTLLLNQTISSFVENTKTAQDVALKIKLSIRQGKRELIAFLLDLFRSKDLLNLASKLRIYYRQNIQGHIYFASNGVLPN